MEIPNQTIKEYILSIQWRRQIELFLTNCEMKCFDECPEKCFQIGETFLCISVLFRQLRGAAGNGKRRNNCLFGYKTIHSFCWKSKLITVFAGNQNYSQFLLEIKNQFSFFDTKLFRQLRGAAGNGKRRSNCRCQVSAFAAVAGNQKPISIVRGKKAGTVAWQLKPGEGGWTV